MPREPGYDLGTPSGRIELAKDVSGFANAEGGYLIVGLPSVSWLTFRRTFATWADQNGMSAKQRGELMGNSADVNALVYTQVIDGALRSAVERVSGELFSDCSVASERVN
jgi:hypothetical protein